MKLKKQFVSLLLVLGMILGCTLTGTDSLAASYGDSLNLSGQQIELNGTTNFTCIGNMCHRSKRINGKVQGLFPKKIKTKMEYTIKCSVEEDFDDKDCYTATFDIRSDFISDPKIKMKKITAISEDAIGNTLTPYTFTTVFDYETGENLEYTGGNDNYSVSIEESKEKNKYYPKQKYRFRPANGGPYKKSYIQNTKSSSYTYTVTYPKTCKNVCVGIGLIDIKGTDFQPGTDDGWFDGKVEKYGDSMFYKDTVNNIAYIRLPGDE